MCACSFPRSNGVGRCCRSGGDRREGWSEQCAMRGCRHKRRSVEDLPLEYLHFPRDYVGPRQTSPLRKHWRHGIYGGRATVPLWAWPSVDVCRNERIHQPTRRPAYVSVHFIAEFNHKHAIEATVRSNTFPKVLSKLNGFTVHCHHDRISCVCVLPFL